MESAGILLRVTQVYAWGVFLGAWMQMGWVDWKEQKIRNHFLFFWLKFVLAGYALILAQSLLGGLGIIRVFILRDYYQALALHSALSVTAAYSLWWLRIWPAGDVKLYSLLALCYPLMRIPGSFRSGLLFLEVLINVFVPAAVFLFLTAGEYLWRTRFAHYKNHLSGQLKAFSKDFKRPSFSLPAVALPKVDLESLKPHAPEASPALPPFDPMPRLREAASSAWLRVLGLWAPAKEEVSSWIAGYKAEPSRLAFDAVSWLSMVAIMSMISYYLNDVIASNVLKTVFCFALMFTWSRFCQFIGTRWAIVLVLAVCAVLLYRHPHVDFHALGAIFGHITVFSLFIFLGVQLAFRIIAGRTGWVFLPFVMMLPGLIPFRWIFGKLWAGLGVVFAALAGGAEALRGSVPEPHPVASLPSAVPSLPALPALPAIPALHIPAIAAPAWVSTADLSGLATWAMMGLFFGLALVFVKIWDAESYKTVPIDHIEKFMTLGPSLVERIEADEDFRDEHFPTFYADGLTGDQAEALRAWCKEEGLEAVPLAPTISFANWIFLGYFLTRLLEGHVLRFLY